MPAVSVEAPFAALARDAERIGVTIDPVTARACARYSDMLLERNTHVNLTAITDPLGVATKHFLDSFTAFAVRTWSGTERVVDVGSGAGFPGLALRIAAPRLEMTLVESNGKKARFLEEVTTALGLERVEIRNERAESLARRTPERYDIGVARAVGPLAAVVEYLLPFLRIGGDAIVWKGRLQSELAAARHACVSIGGEIVAIRSTHQLGVGDLLPGRSLVVVRKVRRTPARFPRSPAEVKRRPW